MAIWPGKRVGWTCRDVSIDGVLVQVDAGEALPKTLELELKDVGSVRSRLVRSPSPGLAAFAFESPEARPSLIRKLYFSDDYIPVPERWGLRDTVGAFFKRLMF
jgi:hypothetical protein